MYATDKGAAHATEGEEVKPAIGGVAGQIEFITVVSSAHPFASVITKVTLLHPGDI